jgi:alpha-mannosidase
MDTFFIIPHTHWEGAVFKTREQYLKIGLPNILHALQLLKTQPDFRFVLDQACYVRPFLERYPEETEAFLQFIEEGRLEIAGGLDVMVDANIPGGESFVRQVLYGKGFFRRVLGVEVTSGWLLDTFGQNAQMPQLLKLSGYRAHWCWRGAADYDRPAEYLWEGIDGTHIPVFWLPYGYGLGYHSPHSLPEFQEFFSELYGKLRPFYRSENVVALAGVDVGEPEGHLAELIEEANKKVSSFNLRMAVPSEYEAAIDACGLERPVVRGEMNPIFQGGYSSRIVLKKYTRELERLLIAAEKLGAILGWFDTSGGQPVASSLGQQRIWQAWEPMLFNQAHDLMSGVMTDYVYEDTVRGYEFTHRIARDELLDRMGKLASKIDTSGKDSVDNVALIVFNPSGYSRTNVATVEVGFGNADRTNIQLTGLDGKLVPYQIIDADHRSDGNLLRAQIAFVAHDVPALGYCVYHLVFLNNVDQTAPRFKDDSILAPDETWLENEYFRLEFDPASGAILKLIDKEQDWSVLGDRPGNVIVMEEDHGDLWELYRPLDGASTIAMKERHAAPQPGQAVFSTDPLDDPAAAGYSVQRGAVFSQYTVSRPFSTRGHFETTVRLVTGSRRIEIITRILNNDQFVRYRALFPTTVENGVHTHEIPFGAIQRPEGIEMPAQNWVDTSDGQRGIALLNRGLPGNNIAGGTLMLSLMRSTCIVAYGFFGGYEPGMSSDSGFELGRELTFDYALLPHAGDWREAQVYRHGQEFNNPLIVQKETFHPGELPGKWGFLDVSHPNILVSALKPGENEAREGNGGVILRLYEAGGVAVDHVKVRLPAQLSSAEEVNLMEDPVRSLEIEAGIVQLDFHPFEIKTLRVQ